MPLKLIEVRRKQREEQQARRKAGRRKSGPRGGTGRKPTQPPRPIAGPGGGKMPPVRKGKNPLIIITTRKNTPSETFRDVAEKEILKGGSPKLKTTQDTYGRVINTMTGSVRNRPGDLAMKKGGMNKMLVGGQAKLDKNKNNRIDAQDFAILRKEKAKGRGQGLQDEKMKPGKVMKARRGRFSKRTGSASEFLKRRLTLGGVDPKKSVKPIGTSFDAKMKAQDAGIIDKKTGAGRKRFMEKAKSVKLGKRLLIPIAIGIAGVQALKSKMKKKKEEPKKKMGGGMMNRPMGYKKGKLIPSKKSFDKVLGVFPLVKPKKKMGGGMMQRPMGMMKKGQMIKARGGGMARTKPTKMF